MELTIYCLSANVVQELDQHGGIPRLLRLARGILLTKVTLEGLDDERGVGESQTLERLGVLYVDGDKESISLLARVHVAMSGGGETHGSGHVGTGDSLRRSVEVVERRRFTDLGDDLGTDSES